MLQDTIRRQRVVFLYGRENAYGANANAINGLVSFPISFLARYSLLERRNAMERRRMVDLAERRIERHLGSKEVYFVTRRDKLVRQEGVFVFVRCNSSGIFVSFVFFSFFRTYRVGCMIALKR